MFSNKVSRKISLRKEMEIFIWAWFEDHNLERVSQKALRTVLPIRSQYTVIEELFWDRGLYIKRCITDILHNPDLSVAPYQERMLSLRSCLKRMLLLVFGNFCQWGRVGWFKYGYTMYSRGKEEKKRKRKFYLNFFCLAIKCEFCFTKEWN